MFAILSQNKNSPNIVKLMSGAGGNIMGNIYGYVRVSIRMRRVSLLWTKTFILFSSSVRMNLIVCAMNW